MSKIRCGRVGVQRTVELSDGKRTQGKPFEINSLGKPFLCVCRRSGFSSFFV
jgi:hypothetical protein